MRSFSRTKSRFIVSTVCLVILSVAGMPQFSYAVNPHPGGHPFRFKLGGVVRESYLMFTTVYLATHADFNNIKTTAGNGIDNSQAPHGFPFIVTIGGAPTTVTVAMSDAAWDDYYSGATRMSSSTFATNCYGYAFSKNYVVPTPAGKNIILADEWVATIYGSDTALPAVFDKDAEKHMVAAKKFCSNPENTGYAYCSETREKNASSGVYKYVYFCPGGGEPAKPWTYYKEK